MRVSPTALPLLGLAITIIGALVIGSGYPVLGGVIFVVGSALDGLDGAVARASGKAGPRGALIDSVADRIGETAVWGGIAVLVVDQYWTTYWGRRLVIACLFCVAGALITSYLRAKADAVGADGRTGLVGRGERVILMGIGLIGGWIGPMIMALLVLIWVTVATRFWMLWRRLGP